MDDEGHLTWCGVPYSSIGGWAPNNGMYRANNSDMAILGVPYDAGASAEAGQAEAPQRIRLLETFEGWHSNIGDLETVNVVDVGDCKIDKRSPMDSLAGNRMWVDVLLENTNCLVSLGGDHSVTAWLLESMYRRHGKLDVVHFDAHHDAWPTDEEQMPDHASWVTRVLRDNLVSSVSQFGIRAMGCQPVEDKRLTNYGRELPAVGNLRVLRNPVYLSIDMDVVDPAYCPGVAYPEPGGWSPDELLRIIEIVVSTCNVVGVDIVETTPALDRSNLSVRLAHRSVLAVRKGIKRKQG